MIQIGDKYYKLKDIKDQKSKLLSMFKGFRYQRKRPIVNLVEEYKLILDKKSKLCRNDRDYIVNKFKIHFEEVILPTACPMEYVEKYCDKCKFKKFYMVSHPGGDSTCRVERYYCDQGFWEDDF